MSWMFHDLGTMHAVDASAAQDQFRAACADVRCLLPDTSGRVVGTLETSTPSPLTRRTCRVCHNPVASALTKVTEDNGSRLCVGHRSPERHSKCFNSTQDKFIANSSIEKDIAVVEHDSDKMDMKVDEKIDDEDVALCKQEGSLSSRGEKSIRCTNAGHAHEKDTTMDQKLLTERESSSNWIVERRTLTGIWARCHRLTG